MPFQNYQIQFMQVFTPNIPLEITNSECNNLKVALKKMETLVDCNGSVK